MSQKTFAVAWKNCSVCEENFVFKSPREFCDHLRDFHCTREGGSFVCQYGHNKICLSLPLEGVSDQDYEDHVARDHVADAGKREIFQRHSRNSSNNSAIIFGNNEPSVVQDQFKWTVYMASVNLSAVLNDPRLGKRDTAIFSKTWGEGFERVAIKPSHLQYITYEHFKTYTDNTAVRHNKHIQNQSILPVEYIDQDKLSEFVPPRLKHNDTGQSEIDAIPKLFLNPTFSLENPTTFNNVLPWSHLEQHGRRSSKLLQEKLSHYLDIVEVQLARQISQRSESFFSVMSSQHELEDYLSRTCCSIKELREKLKQIDAKLVNGPLKMLKSSKQRSNYVKLHNKLKLMSTVHQTQPTLQLLLSTNEFVGALDLIATTQEVLTQELPGVHCFRHLSSQLSEMEKVIVKMMEEDFISYVTGDLNRPLNSERSAIDEERLVSITLGMLRQHKFSFMDIYKEEAVTAIKATLVQTVVEAVADIDADTTSGGLAYQMRLLDYDQWMNLLLKLFENLMIMLQRIKYISSSILEVCQSASCASVSSMTSNERSMASHDGTRANCQNIPNQCSNHSSPIHNGAGDQNGPVDNGDISGYIGNEDESDRDDENYDDLDTSVPTTPISSITATFITDSEITIRRADYLTLYRNIHEMLGFLCDNVHERCSKVLTARAKDGFLERLSSAEFLLLSRSIEEFTSRCEQVAGKRSTALRSCLQSQANRYVNKFHEERKIKLSLIIDNERWKQADVPPDFQALVDHIENTGSLSLPKKSATTRSKSSECIIVSNESYAVVGTVLMLWKMIVEYCQCLDDIPASAPDLLTKLVELLQTFNSRTCQLILGAGALQLVGLKTITARNLALASRCLQLILHYLPTIRKHFEQYLTPKQSTQLKHFNNIIRDYEHHIAEVSSKFQSIMDNSFDKFLEKWEIKPPMPSPCFKNICDRFKKFYESINDLLPPAQMARLVLRIHESLKSKLRVHLIRLCVLNDGGPQHGLVTADIAYYTDQMKSLPGLAQTNDDMSSIWDKT